MRRLRIIGPGRAGGALGRALGSAGWTVLEPLRRGDDVRGAAGDTDLLVIATPDAAIAEVAAVVEPADAVVAHLAGSRGLDVLAPHPRRAAIHPLVSLPDAEVGAARLTGGAWFAVAGDPLALEVVDALGGRAVEVADEDRAVYHAAACIASNHVVALLGQVERLAERVGVPLEAYLALAAGSVDNVQALGAAAALTGPAARGDVETLERHRADLPREEVELYDVLVEAARRLAAQRAASEGLEGDTGGGR